MIKKPLITLHLGVHKTATTHIQSRLFNSMDILNKQDISYLPLEDTRKLITLKLLENPFSKEAIIDSIKPYLHYNQLIISDENILGGTNRANHNKIYHNTVKRLNSFLSIFENYEIQAHITLRNYADYFISRYTESLRHFKFVTFEEYYKNIDFDTVSWTETIEQIKKAGIKNLTIVPYENIFKDEDAYMELLLGRSDIKLAEANVDPSTKRSKFSQQGYDVIKFYSQNYSDISSKKLLHIIDRNEQTVPSTPFMPFSTEQYNAMSDRYYYELTQLIKG